MVKKIKWVEVEVSDNASFTSEGNCTTYYSAGGAGASASVSITNTRGKKTKVGLGKGARVQVCDDTQVATVQEGASRSARKSKGRVASS
jgi:hypothetical protein